MSRILRRLFVLPLSVLLLALPLFLGLLPPGNAGLLAPAGEVYAQAGCPSDPGDFGFPAANVIERTEFCVYYDNDVTAAQATTAADHVQAYWDRYTDDFGFNAPAFTDKLEVLLTDGNPGSPGVGCNGSTGSGSNTFDTWRGCFGTPESIQKVLGHELFHRVQFNHDTDFSTGFWFYEGTARAMEDLVFTEIDNWATTLTAVSSSFNKQVNTYLLGTASDGTPNHNRDITSFEMRYNSALWWKYFSEQYGTVTTEPERGVDALLQLWKAAETSDDVAAVNQALTALDAGTNFDTAFRRFIVANWTKDLTGVPNSSYNYLDEDEAGNGAAYGPLNPTNGGTISLGTPASFNNQAISRYGARYFRAQPGANCPVITASFTKDSGDPAFYHVVTQQGNSFASHVENDNTSWTQSFLNNGITQIVAIAGSLGSSSNVDVSLSCADPVLNIQLPNDGAVAFAGPFGTPGKFLAQVLVTNGTPTAPVVGGLTINDFKARVNGVEGLITAGGFIQEQYWLVIDAPVQASDGVYDLEIVLETPGTTNVIASDTNSASVRYTNDNLDHVLVIDRSGSMVSDGKLNAAKDAANFYVDITRNSDGLAVVPYNGNVSPAPFDMQSVNLNVRTNAKAYINDSALSASGSTSIGDGMQEAADQRNASPTGNPRCSYVLLSDGMENSAAFWNDVRANVQATGCPVTSIAFGEAADETLMQQIAAETGGAFFFNDVFVSGPRPDATSPTDTALDLADTYEYAQSQGEGRERLLLEQGSATLFVDQSHEVVIDDSMTEALFALDWATRGLFASMRLIAPDGTEINSRTLPYTFQDSNSGHLGWRIPNPQAGTWQMIVRFESVLIRSELNQSNTIPYQVLVSGPSSLTVELLLPALLGQQFFTGQPVPIYAFVSGASPIPGLPVQAIVTAPDNSETIVPLYDDGNHDDGAAGDGFYAGVYTRVNQAAAVAPVEEGTNPNPRDEGSYQVRVLAANNQFQREARGAFSVLEGTDANSNGLPDPFEQEYGVTDPNADPDLDGLDNLSEYLSGTNPLDSDSDNGGENDGSEVLTHSLNPLDPADDVIPAPEFFTARADVSAVQLNYDVNPSYTRVLLYRSTGPNGPWLLRNSELPLSGSYSDPAENGQVYYYRLLAADAQNHRSAVLDSESIRPSDDPIAPEAQVLIDDGAASTSDRNVELSFIPYEGDESLASFGDIAEVLISNEPSFAGAQWQPFRQDIPWRLGAPDSDGMARVYVSFRDAAGNESIAAEVASIQLEGMELYLPWLAR